MSEHKKYRLALFAAILVFLAIRYPSVDGSKDAAIYAGDGAGDFTTIQSAIDAATTHDLPRMIYLQAGRTFTESVMLQNCGPTVVFHGGEGTIWSPGEAAGVFVSQHCPCTSNGPSWDCEAFK